MAQKVYLDTNMVLDLFILQGRTLQEQEIPAITKKFAFLVEHKEKFQYITSVLTEAEIVRELRSGLHWPAERIEKLWGEMLQTLGCCYIPTVLTDHRLVDVVSQCAMRLRTLMNFQHVFVAIQENALFVTGDKDLVQKLREIGMGSALSYLDLRALAES